MLRRAASCGASLWSGRRNVTRSGGHFCRWLSQAVVEVDLRSDTVTVPTALMRKAMAEAVVGDDVLGEDVTVQRLESRVAGILGKERGLFVPSGTMANLIALMVHCNERSSEAYLGHLSHIYLYEQGASAFLAGVHVCPLQNQPDGTFDLEVLKTRLRAEDIHLPKSKLICIENSHNYCGGKVLPVKWLKQLQHFASTVGLPVHLDGARLINSSISLGVPVTDLSRCADSVSLCLSKGLGAPVGSVLVGTQDFVQQARRYRKALGGGMRQSGVLAAAGLVALDEADCRARVDHERALLLSESIVGLQSPLVQVEEVQTNIIMLNLNSITAQTLVQRLMQVTDNEANQLQNHIHIKSMQMTASKVRLVLHASLEQRQVLMAIQKLGYVIRELQDSYTPPQ